jgi:general secretion pathway protein A
MYNDHFSLNLKPFQITADPKFLWLGEKHKEALATLRYGIYDNRGFLLLTGEVGTGKTVLINSLMALLKKNTLVANLKDPDLDSLDFYNVLANEFRINQTFASKGQFLIHFRNFLLRCHKNNQQVLLIIDESQRLSHQLMEGIRTLSNIELHDHKLINIFFVGQQEFNNTLMTPENRALSQRITVRYHIDALDEAETGNYIRHRLKVAGTEKEIFDNSAVSEIYKISRGLPRLINIICDHALLTAFILDVQEVNEKIIEECAEELRIPLHAPKAQVASFREGKTPPSQGKHPDSAGADIPVGSTGNESVPAGYSVVDSAELRSFRWSRWLSNLAAIVVILGVLTYFIDRYIDRHADNSSLIQANPHSNTDANNPPAGPKTTPPETVQADGRDQSASDPAGGAANASENLYPVSRAPEKQGTPNQSSDLHTRGKAAALTTAEKNKTEKMELFSQKKVLISFTISSNEIDASSYTLLDKVASYLAYYPKEAVNLYGYTDNQGPESFNERMSFFRANVVKSYLIGKGVYPDRIFIYAMGGANPVASNTSVAGRRKNRRVEVTLRSEQ